MDVLILIGSFTVACLAGMPVAYALGLAAILAALWTGIPLEAVMLKVSGGMSGFSLLAIPFFILAGAIMAVGGMAERLVNLAKVFVGFIRGGMALVNIVASTLFGCISGSSVADTAAVGSVMIPQMIRHGYPRLFMPAVTSGNSAMLWYQVACTSLRPQTTMKRLVASMQISSIQPSSDLQGSARKPGSRPTPICRCSR